MSRRRVAVKRPVAPDPKYGNDTMARFINRIMERGKKSVAQRLLYGAVEQASKNVGETDPVKVIEKAIDNVKPLLEVKSRRIGGATYQVPVEVRRERQVALAMRWIVQFARDRKGMPMAAALAAELTDAFKGTGAAIKKREDTHKMAEANKAFAHYRW